MGIDPKSGLSRRAVLGSAAATAAILAAPSIVRAQAADQLRFSLEFRIYGANSPMFLAAENGIFRDQRLEMALDGSAGSGETVTRIASGTHDFGYADLATVAEFGARNPGAAPKVLMTVFDRFPAVILSLKRKPIKTLQDLVGAKIGTGTSDAGSKIFPALMASNKLDPNSINRVTVDVKLRDTLLIKGDVDGVIAFDYTAIFNLIEAGVKFEDINLFYFSDYGFDFWGNSLLASQSIIQKNPDLVRRVALACARATVAGAKNRDAAIAAVTKRDKLLDAKTERQRLDWVYDKLILTENVKKNGLGHIDPDRMKRGLDLLAQGFQLSPAPTMASLFDERFLPPAADRKFA